MNALFCIGHRGARGYEPENTLRSIRRALELGAQGVEIDVWWVDGQLVIIHDARLERTTNGKGWLRKKTFAQLRELDAGLGERIPTLREVFETVAGRAIINIELKGRGTALPVLALVEEFVRERGWRFDQFIVSSFRRRELVALRGSALRLGLLCVKPTPLYYLAARRLGVWSVHPSYKSTSRRFVEDAHRRGYQVWVYTVNEPHEIERMRELGVDGVFSDYPDRVLQSGGSVQI